MMSFANFTRSILEYFVTYVSEEAHRPYTIISAEINPLNASATIILVCGYFWMSFFFFSRGRMIEKNEDDDTFEFYCHYFEGTLMQIWKSANTFIFTWKWSVKNFTLNKIFYFLRYARTWDVWKVSLQTFRNNRIC